MAFIIPWAIAALGGAVIAGDHKAQKEKEKRLSSYEPMTLPTWQAPIPEWKRDELIENLRSNLSSGRVSSGIPPPPFKVPGLFERELFNPDIEFPKAYKPTQMDLDISLTPGAV